MNVDGDADAAMEARIRIDWNKFRQLVPSLTNKEVSLIIRGKLYSSYVRNSRLYCMKVRPGQYGKKMRWHFSKHKSEWSDGCAELR